MSSVYPKATLVVNVASHCQHADKNYHMLQELHREFGPSHFTVLAFPCNQFGESEPGTSQESEYFAKANYGVTFPIFSKIKILGSEASPAFRFLIGKHVSLFEHKKNPAESDTRSIESTSYSQCGPARHSWVEPLNWNEGSSFPFPSGY